MEKDEKLFAPVNSKSQRKKNKHLATSGGSHIILVLGV
jgi:hypothetical protein